ncbi:MAG TPA: hypothetical protein VMG10_19380 [Gemmataceae bacterium]|nr:hypothetical protein [Gemmataceae bacterium]
MRFFEHVIRQSHLDDHGFAWGAFIDLDNAVSDVLLLQSSQQLLFPWFLFWFFFPGLRLCAWRLDRGGGSLTGKRSRDETEAEDNEKHAVAS